MLGCDGDFMIDKTYIKYWPAEYHSQSAIDAVLQLRPKVAGREIQEIHIKSFEAAVSIIGSEPEKLRPTSRETADHSMFYCCAAALVDGDVTLPTFDDARLTDPVLLDLIDKTTIVEDAELNKGYPKGIPNDITITCADGTKVNKRVDFPRGHAQNPMTDDEVIAKFNRMADGAISPETAATILVKAWSLDSMTDITPFGYDNDVEFTEHMIKEIGVAVVPASSFYRDPADGRSQVRFCFCKNDETLKAASERLKKLRVTATR